MISPMPDSNGRLRVAMLACPYGDGPERIAPLGAMSVLSYAQTALGNRIEGRVFDLSSESPSNTVALESLIAWRPAVVGVPVYTNQVAIVDRWMAAVRAALPDALRVAGGPHPTLTANTYLSRRPGLFHLLIRGDGEAPFTELLGRVLAGEHAVSVPGATYLDAQGTAVRMPESTPVPPEEMADALCVPIEHRNDDLLFTDRRTGQHRKAVALVSSRSCPLKCSFCAIIAMPGKWRSVPTDNLMAWLRRARERTGFEHVYFMDANYFVVPTRVREIAHRFEQELPGVTWSASSTVGMLLKVADDLPALKRSGLRMVEMGIEAGSQRQLRFLNKAATVQQNLDAVRALQRNRIDIGLDFIMFYPDQTLEDLRDNLRYLRNAHLTLQDDFGHLFNSLTLYPGTPIRDLYAARHKIAFDPDTLPDIDPLFVHPEVRTIHRLFSGPFRAEYLPAVEEALAVLRAATRRLRDRSPAEAQRCRLLSIHTHHLPYRVLWELAHAPLRETLEDTLPWLPRWKDQAVALGGRFGEDPAGFASQPAIAPERSSETLRPAG